MAVGGDTLRAYVVTQTVTHLPKATQVLAVTVEHLNAKIERISHVQASAAIKPNHRRIIELPGTIAARTKTEGQGAIRLKHIDAMCASIDNIEIAIALVKRDSSGLSHVRQRQRRRHCGPGLNHQHLGAVGIGQVHLARTTQCQGHRRRQGLTAFTDDQIVARLRRIKTVHTIGTRIGDKHHTFARDNRQGSDQPLFTGTEE